MGVYNMQTGERAQAQDIYSRIFQLERRIGMDWYSKDQLLDDLHSLREVIQRLARRHEYIQTQVTSYYDKIDLLVERII